MAVRQVDVALDSAELGWQNLKPSKMHMWQLLMRAAGSAVVASGAANAAAMSEVIANFIIKVISK